jgi:hypothetical protein
MGLLTAITEEKKPADENSENQNSENSTHPENPPASSPPDFCDICGGVIFWESCYLDSIWRCGFCEQPPAMTLAAKWACEGVPLAEHAARLRSERGEFEHPNDFEANRSNGSSQPSSNTRHPRQRELTPITPMSEERWLRGVFNKGLAAAKPNAIKAADTQ